MDTTNKKAIEAGISVYNRAKGKPIVNSADAGDRITNIDLAAANDAICIALCSSGMVAADNDERMMHCQNMLERGMSSGMELDRGSTRYSSLSKECRTNRWKFLKQSKCSLIWD